MTEMVEMTPEGEVLVGVWLTLLRDARRRLESPSDFRQAARFIVKRGASGNLGVEAVQFALFGGVLSLYVDPGSAVARVYAEAAGPRLASSVRRYMHLALESWESCTCAEPKLRGPHRYCERCGSLRRVGA